MPDSTNGSPRRERPTTHPELRLALLHLTSEILHRANLDAAAAAGVTAGQVDAVRAALFPPFDPDMEG